MNTSYAGIYDICCIYWQVHNKHEFIYWQVSFFKQKVKILMKKKKNL